MKVATSVLVSLLFILGSYPSTQGARILAVLPFFTRSHHRFFQPVLKSLARAGHEVVVYSPFPLDRPEPNYTDVVLDNVSAGNKTLTQVIHMLTELPAYRCIDVVMDATQHVFGEFIDNDQIRQLLSSKEHFDLVFTELYLGQEFILLLGHLFNAAVINLLPFTTNLVVNEVFGNPLSMSYIPDLCSPFSNKMTLYERTLNTIYIIRGLYYVYYQKYLPDINKKYRRHFPDAPPLADMINNVSLVFVNDHETADHARPRTPNIIPVAGIHIEDTIQLSEPFKSFMDNAPDGVILFSLGSMVPDELQPREYFDMYINVFRLLKQRVLWKTRKENIQDLPDNVMTVKWAPQRDVLAHPNCVLFITHGGLFSQHEAIHFGVPVVSIPYFYDQHRNARFYEEKEIGLLLDPQELTEFKVMSAIRTVLDDPKYYKNMKKLSSVFRDRPMTPAQTVVFWTEYVLRHGASHLRPASTQLSWYQLALLDVLAAILALLVSLALAVYFIGWKIFGYVYTLRQNHEQIKLKGH